MPANGRITDSHRPGPLERPLERGAAAPPSARGGARAVLPRPGEPSAAAQDTLICPLCAASVSTLDRSSAAPFVCDAGHALGVEDLVVRPQAGRLELALDGLARSVEQASRAVGKAIHRYRSRERQG